MHNHNIVATTGSYIDRDGNKKYLNKTVGKMIKTQHGMKIKLDASFNPAGLMRNDDGSVWLSIFEPRDNHLSDDSIPF